MKKIKSIVGDKVFFSDIRENPYWDEMYDRLDGNAFFTADSIVRELMDRNISEYFVVDRELTIDEYGKETLIFDILKMKAEDIINLSLNIKQNREMLSIVNRMVGDHNNLFDRYGANQR